MKIKVKEYLNSEYRNKDTSNEIIKLLKDDLQNIEFTDYINACDVVPDIDIEIDQVQDVEEIQDLIKDYIFENNLDQIEIIYYSKAMDYLHKNDFSLFESMQIAAELGYETKNLSSELLASLHASRNHMNNFDIQDEIQEAIDKILDIEIELTENPLFEDSF
jgi:hypothetical protein